MIEQEVIRITEDPSDDGSRLNDLADEFRRGRDVDELLILLDSRNPELVSAGSWILGELPVDLYDSEKILLRLRRLTDHDDPFVRFHSFGAIFPFLSSSESSSIELISKIRNDANKGVRARGEAAARSLGLA